jgi:hypothetical protein
MSATYRIDEGGEGEKIEEVREVLPNPRGPVHPQTLIVKSVHLLRVLRQYRDDARNLGIC